MVRGSSANGVVVDLYRRDRDCTAAFGLELWRPVDWHVSGKAARNQVVGMKINDARTTCRLYL